MGRFKETKNEGIEEMKENSDELQEQGSDMTGKAEQVKRLLEQIHLQDDEDVKGIEDTGDKMEVDYDDAFSERVEKPSEDVKRKGEDIKESSSEEREKVESGISDISQSEGISDIGKDTLSEGREKLEKSSGEYDEIIENDDEVVNEMDKRVKAAMDKLTQIWKG